MGSDEQVWRRQFDQLADAVEPFVIELGDGVQGIGPGCQPAVARSYSAMLQVGYAKGWVA